MTKNLENATIICLFSPVSLAEDCLWVSQVPEPSGSFYGSDMGETKHSIVSIKSKRWGLFKHWLELSRYLA